MKNGIVLVALGYPLYGCDAFNLAMGLKAYDPEVPIAIIHDDTSLSKLTDQEKSFFDIFIPLPKDEYIINGKPHYPRAKLLTYKYSPFDLTIYMDVDNIWHPEKKVSHLFGEIMNDDFSIGMCGFFDVKSQKRAHKTYTFWGEPRDICEYHGIKTQLLQTISGFFSFKKSEYAEKIFNKAIEVYDDSKTPNMPWAGGKPDEYCFNVALSLNDFKFKVKHVFYFDKVNGTLSKHTIYHRFWGTAIGGNKVPQWIVDIYNKLVNKYCIRLNIPTRHYHVDKCKVINERKHY